MKLQLLMMAALVFCFLSGCISQTDPTTGEITYIPTPKLEALLQQVDMVAESIPALKQSIDQSLDTPVGKALIPEQAKGIIGLITTSLAGGAALYLNNRKNKYRDSVTELALAEENFFDEDSTGNKEMRAANNAALQPKTKALLRKMGWQKV